VITPHLSLTALTKYYSVASGGLAVLDRITLEVTEGDFIAVCGPSGCGKSTLLNILGCLDGWNSGQYRLAGIDVDRIDDDARAALRLRHIGFVFQSFNLVPRLSVLRNVELPMIYAGLSKAERLCRTEALIEQVGLSDKITSTPGQLSGGQQQRVAIARALANDPRLLLLDEPTGNLDSRSGEMIMDIFATLHAQGRTIVVVTHDPGVAARACRTLVMRDGVLQRGE
jgi:putative ABC transport system ATP-binding protein